MGAPRCRGARPLAPTESARMILHTEKEQVSRRSNLRNGTTESADVWLMKRKLLKDGNVPPHDKRLYALEVFILSGPTTEEFVKRNPVICRTIEIRGDQTLQDLHVAIFNAFDREDEHMYEFQFGKGPFDPKGKRYVLNLPFEIPGVAEPAPAGDVESTAIGSLGLKMSQAFGY